MKRVAAFQTSDGEVFATFAEAHKHEIGPALVELFSNGFGSNAGHIASCALRDAQILVDMLLPLTTHAKALGEYLEPGN